MADQTIACPRCGVTRQVNCSRPDQPGCRDCRGLHRHPLGDWTAHAACADPQHDQNWWYADNHRAAERKTAINICHDCPVEMVCLEVALANDEPWGVWGGMTVDERKRLRRERRKAM